MTRGVRIKTPFSLFLAQELARAEHLIETALDTQRLRRADVLRRYREYVGDVRYMLVRGLAVPALVRCHRCALLIDRETPGHGKVCRYCRDMLRVA